MAPKPPFARRAPAKPWHASIRSPRSLGAPRQSRGTPRYAAPVRSARPGKAVARLDTQPPFARRAPAKPWHASIRSPRSLGAPRQSRGTPRYAAPVRSARPGKAVARLDTQPPFARRAPAKPWHASIRSPRSLGAPRQSRGTPRYAAPVRSARPGKAVARLDTQPPFARRISAKPWRASISVGEYHRRCYAPVARRRARRSCRASLPRGRRDPQGLEGEVRARQAHGSALGRPRAALGRALSGELRLPAADLLRGRRPAGRARARSGARAAALHPARAGHRRAHHARREGPGRQDHRRARRRSGVRALRRHRAAAASPIARARALRPRLQGARGEDRGGRALSGARRGRARHPRRVTALRAFVPRPEAREGQVRKHPGALIYAPPPLA